jgi:hypothetical protein
MTSVRAVQKNLFLLYCKQRSVLTQVKRERYGPLRFVLLFDIISTRPG